MKISDSPVRTYGGEFRGPCPREDVEQISWFNRIRQEYPETWGILATHTRNEDRLGTAQAMKRHKLEGLVTGASDIFIVGSPCAVIELKRLDCTKSSLSEDQRAYLIAAEKAGAFTAIAFGAVAAYEAFTEWLALQPEPMPF